MNLHPEFIEYWKRKGYFVHKEHGLEQWVAKSLAGIGPNYIIAWTNSLGTMIIYHCHKENFNQLTEKSMLQYVRFQVFL